MWCCDLSPSTVSVASSHSTVAAAVVHSAVNPVTVTGATGTASATTVAVTPAARNVRPLVASSSGAEVSQTNLEVVPPSQPQSAATSPGSSVAASPAGMSHDLYRVRVIARQAA